MKKQLFFLVILSMIFSSDILAMDVSSGSILSYVPTAHDEKFSPRIVKKSQVIGECNAEDLMRAGQVLPHLLSRSELHDTTLVISDDPSQPSEEYQQGLLNYAKNGGSNGFKLFQQLQKGFNNVKFVRSITPHVHLNEQAASVLTQALKVSKLYTTESQIGIVINYPDVIPILKELALVLTHQATIVMAIPQQHSLKRSDKRESFWAFLYQCFWA